MAKSSGMKGGHTQPFVIGSRPAALRAPPIPRIKPNAASTTQYGKASAAAPQNPSPQGASFGDTGLTNMS